MNYTNAPRHWLPTHQLAIAQMSESTDIFHIEQGKNYQINHLREPFGSGFSDFYDFGRVVLGRGRFVLRSPQHLQLHTTARLCGVNIVISGRHQILYTKYGQRQCAPGQIWLRCGQFGTTQIQLRAQEHYTLLSLDFDATLLARIPVPSQNAIIQFFQYHHHATAPQMFDVLPAPQRLLGRATQLLHQPCARDIVDCIKLEGAALELLGLLLHATGRPGDVLPPLDWSSRADIAVRRAIEVLNERPTQAITIPLLARLVGLNECTLKRAFRQHTGKSIAVWRRDQRLALTLALLDEGLPLPQVAVRCGYLSPAYFVKVFEGNIGYHPRYYKKHY